MSSDVGEALAQVRVASGLTQREVAERMGGNQTRVSRIESGEGAPADNAAFLEAIGTSDAQWLAQALNADWKHLPRPSYLHSDLRVLVAIEGGLDQVRSLLEEEGVSKVLAGHAQLLEERLKQAGQDLLNLDYEVVYVGDIGVGKTTALCRQAGLVLDEESAKDLKGMLLDTGGGRTTQCEVRIEPGERFSLAVHPVSEPEIYRLVEELCRGIVERQSGEASSDPPDVKPPEEVERALRNMAGLVRPRPRKGQPATPDPVVVLAEQFDSPKQLVDEFCSRLCLWRRMRGTLAFDGADPIAGRQWLKSTFTSINNGRHEEFSLPARITVTVPFSLVPQAPQSFVIVDTKGVDGSAIRTDIAAHLNNPRALTLLCSKWGSAPDSTGQDLLKHVLDAGADPTLLHRVAIVVLARAGEALSTRHDSGESPEDVEEGYDLKLAQVEAQLHKIGLPGLHSVAFDAAADHPQKLIDFVLGRIVDLRKAQADEAFATIGAINQMIENQEGAETVAAFELVSSRLDRFANEHSALDLAGRRAYTLLLDAVGVRHARTVWATTRRSGHFWNFNVFQYLGDGAATVARARSTKVVDGLSAIIQSDMGDPSLTATNGFLSQILANMPRWEAAFLDAVRHEARSVYIEPLANSAELWDACEDPYGRGQGDYREGVKQKLREWFEENNRLHEELERRVYRVWESTFIAPLKRAAGQGPDSNGTE